MAARSDIAGQDPRQPARRVALLLDDVALQFRHGRRCGPGVQCGGERVGLAGMRTADIAG